MPHSGPDATTLLTLTCCADSTEPRRAIFGREETIFGTAAAYASGSPPPLLQQWPAQCLLDHSNSSTTVHGPSWYAVIQTRARAASQHIETQRVGMMNSRCMLYMDQSRYSVRISRRFLFAASFPYGPTLPGYTAYSPSISP